MEVLKEHKQCLRNIRLKCNLAGVYVYSMCSIKKNQIYVSICDRTVNTKWHEANMRHNFFYFPISLFNQWLFVIYSTTIL